MKALTLKRLLRVCWARFKVSVHLRLMLTSVSKREIIYGEGFYCDKSRARSLDRDITWYQTSNI